MDTITAVQTEPYGRQSVGRKLCILTILAALFSLLGWVAETVLFLIKRGHFVDRGLLTLPFCPMYGLSMLAVYAVLRTPQTGIWVKIAALPKTRTGKFAAVATCVLLYAAAAALLASLFEYITGAFYDNKFGVRLWNYRNKENNIHGYVCLKYTLVWGTLSVAAMGLVWHPLQNVLARAKTAVLVTSAVLLFTAISADFVFNMIYLFTQDTRFLPW